MATTAKSKKAVRKPAAKDYTKYAFEGETFGKSRLVHAVVSHMAKKGRDVMSLFDKKKTGAVFQPVVPVKKAEEGRYFLDEDDIIKTRKGNVAVTNQWGKNNIDEFIEFCKDLKLNITKRRAAHA